MAKERMSAPLLTALLPPRNQGAALLVFAACPMNDTRWPSWLQLLLPRSSNGIIRDSQWVQGCMPNLNGLLGDPLPRKIGNDLVVLMEQEIAPSSISEQVPQVPGTALGQCQPVPEGSSGGAGRSPVHEQVSTQARN